MNYFRLLVAIVVAFGAYSVTAMSLLGRQPTTCDDVTQQSAREKIEKAPLPKNWVQAQLTSDRLGVKRLNCYSQNGTVLFEGDIVVGTVPVEHPKGIAINSHSKRWQTRAIPYTFEDNFGQRARVTKAIQLLEQTGIVKLVPHTNESDYINFKVGDNPNVSASPVGRQGGKQTISIGANCQYGVVLHEVCHSLGLWHEQSRSDRDKYVCVLWTNILPKARFNFDQHVNDGENIGAYDYDSIMHYFSTAFSVDGRSPTILPRKASVVIGQQNHLSRGDIAALRNIFSQNP